MANSTPRQLRQSWPQSPYQIRFQNSEEDEDELIGPIERLLNFMLRHLEADLERVQPIFNLIICMSQLPPALTESGQQLCATDLPGRVWDELPAFGTSIGSAWTNRDVPPEGEKSDRFIAANALAGYLMSHDDGRFNYRELALSTLEEALEHPFPNADQEQHASVLYHIPAAIKLFETVGDKICQWCQESIQASRQDLRQSGPLWTGQSG